MLRCLLVASTMAINFKFDECILNKIELSASCLNLIFFYEIPNVIYQERVRRFLLV